jgi:hypothetical protein
VTVALSGNGTIRHFSGSGFTDVQSYNSGQWYTLRIVADVPNQVFDLYIDGVLAVDSQPFENAVSSLSQIDVATGFSTGTYDVDYVSVQGQALVDDLFDGETTAAAPAGYDINASAGSVAIANVPGSGNKSMQLTDSSGAGVSAFKSFSDQFGTVTCEYKIKASQTTGAAYVELDDETGTPGVQVALSGDGHIRLWYSNGTAHTDVQTYSSSTWYTLKIVANVATHTYDFYVNGSLAGSSQAFDNAVDLFSRVTLSTGFAAGTYDVDYVDVTNS